MFYSPDCYNSYLISGSLHYTYCPSKRYARAKEDKCWQRCHKAGLWLVSACPFLTGLNVLLCAHECRIMSCDNQYLRCPMASNIKVMVQYTNVTSSCTNEQGSFDHTSVYILSFVVVSVVGVFFNWLVLLGVRGNSRLGTTVNILLVWISTSAIMQSTVGALAKILIFGKLTTTTPPTSRW